VEPLLELRLVGKLLEQAFRDDIARSCCSCLLLLCFTGLIQGTHYMYLDVALVK
jgi:hypothetical protein